MKKYIVLIAAVLVVCAVIGCFSVIDRIQYAVNGMTAYDTDDYTEESSPLERKDVEIDFSRYTGAPITLYEIEGAKLCIESITYRGSSYRFKMVSSGISTFERGNIILFNEASDQVTLDCGFGELIYCYIGSDAREGDSAVYYFDLYSETTVDTNAFTSMRIVLPIENMMYVTYERR